MRVYTAMLGALALLIVVLWATPAGTEHRWIREGGPIEGVTAATYIVVLATILARGGRDFWRRYWDLGLVPLVFLLRELDFDKRFTSAGIFTSRLYRNPSFPAREKAMGVILIVLITIWIVAMVARHGREGIEQWRRRSPVAVGVVLVLAMTVTAFLLDGLDRKLRKIGVTVSPAISAKSEVVEECVELAVPWMMLALFVVSRPKKSESASSIEWSSSHNTEPPRAGK